MLRAVCNPRAWTGTGIVFQRAIVAYEDGCVEESLVEIQGNHLSWLPIRNGGHDPGNLPVLYSR